MSVADMPERLRTKDEFHHVDPGFLNQRLCLGALHLAMRKELTDRLRLEDNSLARMANGHLLVTALLDCCEVVGAPTLLEAVRLGKPRHLFRTKYRAARGVSRSVREREGIARGGTRCGHRQASDDRISHETPSERDGEDGVGGWCRRRTCELDCGAAT